MTIEFEILKLLQYLKDNDGKVTTEEAAVHTSDNKLDFDEVQLIGQTAKDYGYIVTTQDKMWITTKGKEWMESTDVPTC